MALLKRLGFIYLYMLGFLFILLSFDVFEITGYTGWELLGGFLMQSMPGLALMLVAFFLRKKPIFLGISLLGMFIFLFFFYGFYRGLENNIMTFLTMVLPVGLLGGILIADFWIMRKKLSKHQIRK